MPHAICSYCQKPVILSPSASERAAKNGGRPADYIALFPNHSTCSVRARSEQSRDLMRQLVQARKANQVRYPLSRA